MPVGVWSLDIGEQERSRSTRPLTNIASGRTLVSLGPEGRAELALSELVSPMYDHSPANAMAGRAITVPKPTN
jgi:hypothetical protein